MHIVIATLYAIIIWLSLMAYTIILDGFWLVVAIAGPIIISALVVGLIALEYLVDRIVKRVRIADRIAAMRTPPPTRHR